MGMKHQLLFDHEADNSVRNFLLYIGHVPDYREMYKAIDKEILEWLENEERGWWSIRFEESNDLNHTSYTNLSDKIITYRGHIIFGSEEDELYYILSWES